jgi:hypothetical protein
MNKQLLNRQGFMKLDELDVIVKIAACVCGKDGVISPSAIAPNLDQLAPYEVNAKISPNC